jgi:lysophospholipase L1-like esterase
LRPCRKIRRARKKTFFLSPREQENAPWRENRHAMMTKAVFFGSSLVAGAGAPSPERRFTTRVAGALGWEEINLGATGSTVTGRDSAGQVVDDESGIARVPDVLEAKPDVVVILYGCEDFRLSREMGDPGRFQQGTFHWDYDTILRGLLFELAPEQVVVSTMPYTKDGECPNLAGLTLKDYNAAIDSLAGRYLLRLLDPAQESMICGDSFAALSSDAATLNDAGHERLAAYFIEALRSWRAQRT